MTPDEMERAIYDAFAAPYGEFVTPALAQQFAISARNAAQKIHQRMQKKQSRTVVMKSWRQQSADKWSARVDAEEEDEMRTDKTYMQEYMANKRKRLVAAGLCVECGKNPAATGRYGRPIQRCQPCNEKTIQRTMQWHKVRKESVA